MAGEDCASSSFKSTVAMPTSVIAPERDYLSEAPEVDRALVAPEVRTWVCKPFWPVLRRAFSQYLIGGRKQYMPNKLR